MEAELLPELCGNPVLAAEGEVRSYSQQGFCECKRRVLLVRVVEVRLLIRAEIAEGMESYLRRVKSKLIFPLVSTTEREYVLPDRAKLILREDPRAIAIVLSGFGNIRCSNDMIIIW
tara:strand:- start:136 stop:486 length:351 start_codon:yes stop_codon:yes gene_type:complete